MHQQTVAISDGTIYSKGNVRESIQYLDDPSWLTEVQCFTTNVNLVPIPLLFAYSRQTGRLQSASEWQERDSDNRLCS